MPLVLRRLRYFFPIATWLPEYRREWFAADALAGLTVWSIMVPAALAYANLAGVPAQTGLMLAPLVLVLYAIFGSSRTLVVGPDSATALLSAHLIGSLALASPEEAVLYSSVLALEVGLLLMLFGALRMGWIASFISTPVMNGFVQGLAVVTLSLQIPPLLGIPTFGTDALVRLWETYAHFSQMHVPSVVLGLGSLSVMMFITWRYPKAPATLIVLVAVLALAWFFDPGRWGIHVLGPAHSMLPSFALPALPPADLLSLSQGALALAILNYTASLAAARASMEKRERLRLNQELLGLGFANLGSAISGGFVVAGSLTQTTVRASAGGHTQMASLVQAVLVLLTILVLMPVFERLPLVVLAAVIFRAMWRLLDLTFLRRLAKVSLPETALSLSAMLGVILLGVLPGIGLGVIMSILLMLYHSGHPATAVLGKVRGKDAFRNIQRRPDARTIPGLLVFRLEGDLFFANAAYFEERIRHHIGISFPPPKQVLLDGETINRIDSTGADALMHLLTDLRARDIRLSLARLRDPVRELLRLTGFEAAIGPENIHETLTQGVKTYCQRENVPYIKEPRLEKEKSVDEVE